jgi:hypothetical protein
MDANVPLMDKFTGINNVDDATRLGPVDIGGKVFAFPLQQANNLIIDNTYALSSRGGFSTSGVTGTDIHSLWADKDNAFYVDGGSLYSFNYTTGNVIRTGLNRNALMSYVSVNDRVYYTNGFQIGYIKNLIDYSVMNPSLEFKQPLPAGECIDYFRGCLLVAKGKVLYISDPLCDYYDTRYGYKILPANINMICSAHEGVYVSSNKVDFLKGRSNEDFELAEAYPSPAIAHTAVKIHGSYLDDSLSGEFAIWTGENGICIGSETGEVVNLTVGRYTFTAHGRGAAFVRESSNVRHYINSLY